MFMAGKSQIADNSDLGWTGYFVFLQLFEIPFCLKDKMLDRPDCMN